MVTGPVRGSATDPLIDDATNDIKEFPGGHWVGSGDPSVHHAAEWKDGHRWVQTDGAGELLAEWVNDGGTLVRVGGDLTVSTLAAINVSAFNTDSAILRLAVDVFPGKEVDVHFEWREVGAGTWNQIPATPKTLTIGDVPEHRETIEGLSQGTQHEFRAQADDSVQTSTGSTLTFTTD